MEHKPASINQTRYVVAELGGVGSYMISTGHVVSGVFDRKIVKRAAARLAQRHTVLRTGFSLENGKIWAHLHPSSDLQTHFLTMPDDDFATFRLHALPLVFQNMDVSNPASLARLVVAQGPTRWRFTFAVHHSLCDGFSRGVIHTEFLKLYVGEELEAVPSYSDYEQPAELVAKNTAYWHEQVAKMPPPLKFTPDAFQNRGDEGRGVFQEAVLGKTPTEIRSFLKTIEGSRFGLLAAAYAITLASLSGSERAAIFFQSAGRRSLGAPTTVVGPFSNTLPIDLSFLKTESLRDIACRYSRLVRGAVAHENASVAEILNHRRLAPRCALNVFPGLSPIIAGDLDVGPREFLDRRIEFDLNMLWTEDSEIVTARCFYDESLFTADRISGLLSLQKTLLLAIMDNPDQTAAALLEKARGCNRASVASVAISAPTGRLHDGFVTQVAKYPDRVAIRSGKKEISYAELHDQARAIAHSLKTAAIGEGDRVGILAERTPELIATMLGVSYAGASFSVIDAAYPEHRIKTLLAQLQPKTILNATRNDISSIYAQHTMPVRPTDTLAEPVTGPTRAAAYHLFTSGTTGAPKLVTHPDTSLLRFIEWEFASVNCGRHVTCALLGGLSHDPIMRDIFLPLLNGGHLVIPTDDQRMDPDDLFGLLCKTGVSVLHLTPALGKLLMMRTGQGGLDAVRATVWGGDRLTAGSVETWARIAPNSEQFNLYGVTETPQAALMYQVPDKTPERIPLGRPMPWIGVELHDDDGAIVSPYDLGEVVITLPEAIRDSAALTGKTVHRTGDLAFMDKDGVIHFSGRRDDMLKLSAYRINPLEITSVALEFEGVSDALALATDAQPSQLRLFVATGANDLDPLAMRRWMQNRLPAYMVPAQVHVLDHLPLTVNGKVDRNALLELSCVAPSIEGDGALVRSGNEIYLADLFGRLSGVAVAHSGQSLRDLGVDSLGAIEARLTLEGDGWTLPDDWDAAPIRDLAMVRVDVAKTSTASLFDMVRIDSFILLRTLAISYIVLRHSDAGIVFDGASEILFLLAGFVFAKLQLPAILENNLTGRTWAVLATLGLALVPMSLVVFYVHLQIGNTPNISALLLYENMSMLVAYLTGASHALEHQIQWLWFLHAYIQVFLLIAIGLSVKPVRNWISRAPFRRVSILAIVLQLSGFLCILLLGGWVDDLGYAQALLRSSPFTILPLVVVGALLALARGRREQVTALAVSALMLVLFAGITNVFRPPVWGLVGPILLFIPFVRVPRAVVRLATGVSGAALIIYLTHRAFFFAFDWLSGGAISGVLAAAVAIVGGYLLWQAYRPVLKWVRIERIASWRVELWPSSWSGVRRSVLRK